METNNEYIEAHNDELTKKYQDLIKLYGVKDYKELMGLGDAVVQNVEKSTSKNKDTSKLQLVQKTVVRRGKPTLMSFYEDPSKTSSAPSQGPSNPTEEQTDGGIADGVYMASEELGSPLPENALKAIPKSDWYSERKYNKSYDYLFYVAGGQIVAVAGIGKNKRQLTVSYVASQDKKQYYNFLYKSICAVIDIAYKAGFGFYFKPRNVPERDLMEILKDFYELSKRSGVYQIPDNKMEKVFGERVWKH